MPLRRSSRKRKPKEPPEIPIPAPAPRRSKAPRSSHVGTTSALLTSAIASTKGKRKREPERIVYVPRVRRQDVMMGRGPAVNAHPGNVAFRNRVRTQYLPRYAQAGKTEKTEICQEIIDQCKKEDIFFLEKDADNDKWFHIAEHTARTKAAQTIHDIIKRAQKTGNSSSGDTGETTTTTSLEDRKPPASRTSSEQQQRCDVEGIDSSGHLDPHNDYAGEDDGEDMHDLHLPDLPIESQQGYTAGTAGAAGALFPANEQYDETNALDNDAVGNRPGAIRRPQAQLRPVAVPTYLRQLSIGEEPQDEFGSEDSSGSEQ